MTESLPQRSVTGRAATIGAVFALLVASEGLTHVAKHERIDRSGVITVCIGRTNYDDPTLKAGDKFTTDECYAFLRHDLPKYLNMVERQIHVPVTINQNAALLDFVYNEGENTLKKSSIARDFNAKRYTKACDDLLKYNEAAGVVLPGLVTRRKAERILCLTPDKDVAPVPVVAPVAQTPPDPPVYVHIPWYVRIGKAVEAQ